MRHWYVIVWPTQQAPLAEAREWATDLATALNLQEEKAWGLVLAVSELLALALATSLAPGQPLRLSGEITDGTLRIVLTWEGDDLPGERADGSPLARRADQRRYLIEECVDHWYLDQSGPIRSAILEIQVHPGEVERPAPSLALPLMPWIDLAWYRRRERSRVLIVEDDDLLRDTLSELLAEAGYAVAEARHGGEALRKLSAGLNPDLILLDLMMPVMDGCQFLRATQSDPALALTPIVVLSAASRNEEALAGVVAFLPKPCDDRRLLQAVSRWCPPAR